MEHGVFPRVPLPSYFSTVLPFWKQLIISDLEAL